MLLSVIYKRKTNAESCAAFVNVSLITAVVYTNVKKELSVLSTLHFL